jgi:hypothetical protein
MELFRFFGLDRAAKLLGPARRFDIYWDETSETFEEARA